MTISLLNETSIGRFELIRHLGRGGMGDVYLAYDPERGTQVALKLIRLSVAAMDPEMLEAEKRGLELQRRLQPRVPEIAAVYDKGELEGFFYVAMEYVEGIDLAEVLRGGPISASRSVRLAIQLCRILEGIQHAADEIDGRTVIHSDIKPENIRVQREERVRLLDFGVAKGLRLSRKFTRNAFGSVPYLAPERLAGEVVNAQTDLWAVGVVLYQMVAGYLPFPGDSSEAMERRIRSGQPPEPLPPDCPPALRSILFKSLCADPTLRFADAADLRHYLEAFLGERPIPISEPTRRTPGAQKQRTIKPSSAPLERPRMSRSERRLRRASFRRSLIRLAVVMVLALAAISHGCAWYQGRAIERKLAESDADLPGLYKRYQAAKWFDPLGLCLSGTAKALKDALLASADRTLSRFRVGAAVEKEEWEEAFHRLRAVSELADAHENVQAKLLLCQGQVARLEAEALLATNAAEAQEKWREAVRDFEEARAIAPELAEADLSLASIYGDPRTNLLDARKLKEVLDEAEHRGTGRNNSLRLALVAAYVREARQTSQRASRAQGREQIDLLYQTLDGYDDAVKLCKDTGFAQTQTVCREAKKQQAAVSKELAARGQA